MRRLPGEVIADHAADVVLPEDLLAETHAPSLHRARPPAPPSKRREAAWRPRILHRRAIDGGGEPAGALAVIVGPLLPARAANPPGKMPKNNRMMADA